MMTGTGTKRRRHSWLSDTVSRLFAVAAAALLLLCYASMFVDPSKAWYMTVFGLLFIPFVLLNLLVLLWEMVRWSKDIIIPVLVLLPAVFLMGRYVQFSHKEVPSEPGNVRIVSYNVGRFSMHKKSLGIEDSRACADSVYSFLKECDADIICLQEFFMPDKDSPGDFLKKKFHGYEIEYYLNVNKGGSYGNVIMSRYKVLSKGKFNFDKSSNMAFYADLDVHGTTLRLYDCHFESYNISLPRLVSNVMKDSTLVRKTEDKMRKSIIRRTAQVDQVISDIEESPVEAIVTGDFNDDPMSFTYRRLTRNKHDSFIEGGSAFGATYRILWPFIRIDYVLYPSHYKCVSHKVPKVGYSDHYPVVADFKI